MHLAVKVAYDGSLFHGSQRQGDDDIASVEGTIARALKKVHQGVDLSHWPLRFSSRTDAGVSALGNVFTIDVEMGPDEFLRALNANMDGVWCWAWGRPRPGQNIRWASSRWYRYHLLPQTVTPDRVQELNEVLSLFKEEHDFSNLCRLEDEKNPVTFIEDIKAMDLSGNGELVVVDVIGSRFLWNQVRRMMGVALSVLDGTFDINDLRILLKEREGETGALLGKVKTLPPTGLVLMDVRFKDIGFEVSDEALGIAIRKNTDMSWEASMRVLLHTAMRSMRR
ncbi:MAG: hypothetical protein JXA22_08200 [Candidatus Thermoplasmatota archaeon]|nr:hypothetical protein [Candidatus Thermoplasmatota archaeon]